MASAATSPSTSTPSDYSALVLESTAKPPTVEKRSIPETLPGTAIVRILAASVLSYTREVLQASDPNYRNYGFPTPLVPGLAAVGRVASVGIDATILRPGQLMFFDPFVRGRDFDESGSAKPPARFLSAISEGDTDGSKHLMANGGIRDGAYAEYLRALLENCYVLDEARLTTARPTGLGYSVMDLCAISTLIIPYGGLRSVDLRPGETILISPATGPFGGAACMVALALGAKVIAWGRDTEKLASLKAKLSTINQGRYEGMIDTVPMTNDATKDLKNIKDVTESGGSGSIDVFFDVSPPAAAKSHHVGTGIRSLRHSGRVSLMGGILEDITIPHRIIMHNDITIKGKWMYERSDVVELVKMVERGVLILGERGGWQVVGQFGLEEWKEAWDLAWEKNKIGEMVVVTP